MIFVLFWRIPEAEPTKHSSLIRLSRLLPHSAFIADPSQWQETSQKFDDVSICRIRHVTRY
jgi:hypothetical protein